MARGWTTCSATACLVLVLARLALALPHPLDFVAGAAGPRGALGMAVSPDGAHAYVTGGGAVTVYTRAALDGELGFVESKIQDVDGVDGLLNARAVAVSPDGAHVYVGSGLAIAVFARNAGTGELTFVEAVENGAGGIVDLRETWGITFSPDGAHVYVVCSGSLQIQHGAVLVFARNAGTGRLTFIESERDELNGVTGMRYATGLVMSPDGAHVYAAGRFDSAIAIFGRNAGTGELTFLDSVADGQGGVDGLQRVVSVAISPDGAHVYAAGQFDDAVAVFARNAGTGALTFVEVRRDGVGGVDGLNGASAVAVSADGAHVYAFGGQDAAVAAFSRNAGTGSLTFIAAPANPAVQPSAAEGAVVLEPGGAQVYVASEAVAVFARNAGTGVITATGAVMPLRSVTAMALSPDAAHLYVAAPNHTLAVFRRDAGTGAVEFVESERDGIGLLDALGSPAAVAVSPDGAHVYVAGGEDAVIAFARDGGTGKVTLVEIERDGVGGVDGLDDARGVAVSPDGNHVYVTGLADDAIAVFARNAGTGALTFLAVVRDGVGGVDGIDGAHGIAISADGEDVYVTGENDDAIAVFARDGGTGLLTLVTEHRQGVSGIEGLDGVSALALSPDGANLYASGTLENAVAAFARDVVTGALTLIDVERSPEAGVLFLEAPGPLAVTSGEVYVARVTFGTGGSFNRRLPAGTLDFVRSEFLNAVVVSPNGAHVYSGVFSNLGTDVPDMSPGLYTPGFAGCGPTPLPSCFTAHAGKLRLNASNNGVTWLWKLGDAVDPSEVGNPGSSTHYAFCVWDESGPPTLVARALAPAGGICRQLYSYYTPSTPCWKNSGDGYKYRDSFRTPEGVLSLHVKPGGIGQSKALLRGGKDLFDPPAFPLGVPVRVQLQASNGECWEATYSAPAVNNSTSFSATPD